MQTAAWLCWTWHHVLLLLLAVMGLMGLKILAAAMAAWG
jgi:hypothetical protein